MLLLKSVVYSTTGAYVLGVKPLKPNTMLNVSVKPKIDPGPNSELAVLYSETLTGSVAESFSAQSSCASEYAYGSVSEAFYANTDAEATQAANLSASSLAYSIN